MKIFLPLLLIIFSQQAAAQSRWLDQYKVKKNFEIGDAQTYEVTEFYKAEALFTANKSEIQSYVRFEIVDTLSGGYWLKYTVLDNAVTKQHDSSTHIIAALSKRIEQYVYMKDGYFHFDSLSYQRNRQMVTERLLQFAADNELQKKTSLFVQRLVAEVSEGNDISSLLGPLMLMQMYFDADVYKKFMVNTKSNSSNVNNQVLFTGTIGNKWESTSKDSTVTLSRHYVGDPVPAARYFKPIYQSLLKASGITKGKSFYPWEMIYKTEYNFTTQPHRSFPTDLHKKTVSEYIWREVGRIEMKKW